MVTLYWKGGRKKQGGYWYILKRDYISTNANGYVREHVYIFQEYYKCCMLPWGVVHHINEDKLDNRIENLQGMLRSKHRLHHCLGKAFMPTVDKSDRFCLICGSKTTVIDPRNGYHKWHIYEDGWKCEKCYLKEYCNKNKEKLTKQREEYYNQNKERINEKRRNKRLITIIFPNL